MEDSSERRGSSLPFVGSLMGQGEEVYSVKVQGARQSDNWFEETKRAMESLRKGLKERENLEVLWRNF